MKLYRLGIVIALSGASLYACGDDSSPSDKQVTLPVADAGGAGGIDAGGVVPASDAARPDAGTVANDAGVTSGRDSAVVDSGVRDSAVPTPTTAPDSAVAMNQPVRDSGLPVVDSGMPSDSTAPGNPGSPACLACGTMQCKDSNWPLADDVLALKECGDFGTETATTGMKAGTLRSKLCEDVLKCFRTTRCAAPGKLQQPGDAGIPVPTWTACLCGDQPYNECTLLTKVSDYKGVCRDALLDAAETEDALTFASRLDDPGFGIGIATRRTSCELRMCADECYAPCKGQADGWHCTGVPEEAPPWAVASDALQGTCQMQSCRDFVSPIYVPWTSK